MKIILVALSLFSLTSCMSAQNHPIFEQVNKDGSISVKSPFVELYIQYSSADEKWAVPQSFVLHVDARAQGDAKISVTPPIYENSYSAQKYRGLASKDLKNLNAEAARKMMREFAVDFADESTVAHYRGCAYPVQVWLVRKDGTVVEKQTCRNANPLARSAARYTHEFLSYKMYGKI